MCTSMTPIANARSSLRAGDVIQVHTTSGKQIDLEVATVDPSDVPARPPTQCGRPDTGFGFGEHRAAGIRLGGVRPD